MTCDAREFFRLFFRELEQRNIPNVILHAHHELPEKIASDIDYAVPDIHLRRLRGIQIELARRHHWALVQTLQHEVFAFYAVLVNLENPTETLRLDACSHYARARRLLVPEDVLLGERRRSGEFYGPAPAAEFIYLTAKMFAKDKRVAECLPRLRELWRQEPEKAQVYFTDLFGDTGKNLEQWFASPPEEWHSLGPRMMARHKFGPGRMAREGARVARRIFQPTGICLTVMGSDGAGKSTLLNNLQKMLEPCFRRQLMFHFRPAVFEKKKTGVVTDPHGQAPRNAFMSWLKVGYYFMDHWIGWLTLVWPAQVRSTLVIFDRGFDDLLVDEKRYRLRGTRVLVGILRRLLPKPKRVFILSASAEVLHQRKPELSVAELARQQEMLQKLAQSGGRYALVSAAEPPEQVAREVWREVTTVLAAREEKRGR